MASSRASTRLDFRLSPERRRLIERAAAIRGQPLTAFAPSSLLSSAEAVVQQDEQRRLSVADRKRFLRALDVQKPNKTLARGARRFAAEVAAGRVVTKR